MKDSVKGMRYFHVCSMGDCKNPGIYPTKNGDCFCKRCVVKHITANGLRDFYPHGLDDLIEHYNHAISIQRVEKKERMLENMWDKQEREATSPPKNKPHRKNDNWM